MTLIATRNNQIIISGQVTWIKRVKTWLKCSSCVFLRGRVQQNYKEKQFEFRKQRLKKLRKTLHSIFLKVQERAGLTIGQTGQKPGSSRIWGSRSWMSKHSFYWIFMFLGCSLSLKIVELFDYCVLYIGWGNWQLWHLSFFSGLKELNQTELRFRIRSKSVHPWVSAGIFPMKTTSKFCLSFSGCWRCDVMDVYKTYPF